MAANLVSTNAAHLLPFLHSHDREVRLASRHSEVDWSHLCGWCRLDSLDLRNVRNDGDEPREISADPVLLSLLVQDMQMMYTYRAVVLGECFTKAPGNMPTHLRTEYR